jgi:hypothetical protein
MAAGLPKSDQTKNHIFPDEKKLSCDKDKAILSSKQARPIIDLTKLPVEAELGIEMEALTTESIYGSRRDKEVQFLESLDKDLKAKDKQTKGGKLDFDLPPAPDLLSLQSALDQVTFS